MNGSAATRPFALRTRHSVFEGVLDAATWAPLVRALPTGCRVLFADRGDLAGLPAAIAAWGRERIAVGTTVRLMTADDQRRDAILVAPDASGYAQLCRFLSWRAESPLEYAAWNDGSGWFRQDLAGLIALVQDQAVGRLAESAGAQVRWRCCSALPQPDGPWPALWLPVLHAPNDSDALSAPLRQALARREGRPLAAGDDPAAAPGDPALVAAAAELLASCTFVPGGRWQMPPSHHADAEAELLRRAVDGMRRRYASGSGARVPAAVRDRLAHELRVIAAKGFASYILTVADLCAGRRTCGRGSGASSLVCYCLGITNVDPVRWNLLFERFLNPAREDPPDLDVDFPWDERDAVLAAAIAAYGRERVAMVANHLHLRGAGALRAAARAFGRDARETSRVRDALDAQRRYGASAELPAPWNDVLAQAALIEGAPHHAGLHCGGIVITPGPLRDLVPVRPAAKTLADGSQVPAIAWEKDGAEAMGLVKIDLLGNRALAVVRDCLSDLADEGIAIDETRWRPADDPATRTLVGAGDTLGCFYIESPAMRQLQARSGSGDFDRLVVHSSIIRPAANRWIATYLERLAAWSAGGVHDPAWYPLPELRGLLSDSFGILSYQEDIMLAAIRIAGFDDREANALRKALGRSDTHERLAGFAQRFRAGALARGADPAAVDAVWENIASFAGYSFCKAHSASYAMISFQCAWLRAHHPAIFLGRVIGNGGGFYTPGAYLEDARRRGVRILPPCVQRSHPATRSEGPGSIRIGLDLVPGLGAAAAQRIVDARPFASIADCRRRARLPAALLLTLAHAGALDALAPGRNRAQIAWLAAAAGLDEQSERDPTPPDLPAAGARHDAWEQYRALGISPACHPIRFCRDRRPPLRARDITPARDGRRVTITAWPITRKQVDSRSPGGARPMAFVTCDDETGLIETVWFPDAYRGCGALLDRAGPLRLSGRIACSFGAATLEVERAEPMALVGACRTLAPSDL